MDYGPAMKDSVNRQQTLENWKKNWRTDWASVKFEREAIVAFTLAAGEKHPGNWVSEWAVITIKSKDGKPDFTFRFNGVSRVTNGKIDVSVAHYDVNDILVQEGFTMTPPAAKKEEAKKK